MLKSAMLQLSASVFERLNLTPDSARMLSAIHEAGHVVVANTAGALVISTSVTSREHIGVDGGDETLLDMPGSRAMTLAEQLPILAAGFQASFLWLGTRGIDQAVRNEALNMLAAGDWKACVQACADACRPDLSMQDGVMPAAQILKARWSTVVRIAYDLARMGALTHADLWPHLIDEARTGRQAALAAYETWRTEFTRSQEGDGPHVQSVVGLCAGESGVPVLLCGRDRDAVGSRVVAAEGSAPDAVRSELAEPDEVEPRRRSRRPAGQGLLRVDGGRVRGPSGGGGQRAARRRPVAVVVVDRADAVVDLAAAHQATGECRRAGALGGCVAAERVAGNVR